MRHAYTANTHTHIHTHITDKRVHNLFLPIVIAIRNCNWRNKILQSARPS